VVCFLCMAASPCEAQTDVCVSFADSLLKVMNEKPVSTDERIRQLHELLPALSAFDMERTLLFAQRGLAMTEGTDRRKDRAAFLHFASVAYTFQSKYDSAKIVLDMETELALSIPDVKTELMAVNMYAFLYARQGKYLTAIEYYLKAGALMEKDGDHNNLMNIYGNIGEINCCLHNYEQAVKYLKRGIEMGERLGLDGLQFQMRNCYVQLAATYYALHQPDLALDMLRKTGDFDEDYTTVEDAAKYNLLSKIFLDKNDCDKALEYAERSLKLAEFMKDPSMFVNAWVGLSDVYLATGRYAEAEETALKAWTADSLNTDANRAVTLNLALAYTHLDMPAEASYFMHRNETFNREHSAQDAQRLISDLEVKYETDMKDAEIVALKSSQRKTQLLLLLLGAVLLLACFLYIMKRRISRKEMMLAAANTAIETESTVRQRIGQELHDNIGGMLAAANLNLGRAENLPVVRELLKKSIDELRRQTSSLLPETLLHYGLRSAVEDYCVKLLPLVGFYYEGEDVRIERKVEVTIYLVAIELIDNACKHAEATAVKVSLIQEKHKVALTVKDDGHGFDPAANTDGAGLHNVRARLAACGGKIRIKSSGRDGAEITVEIDGI